MEIGQQYINPLVSVIIPCCNSERWIADSIASVLNQTYKNLDIIVVDDGSTDGTANIVASFKDKNVSYYFKDNGGASSARNLGIKKAKGTLIAFLDSDDFWHESKIEAQVNAIQRGYDFVYCDYELIDSENRPLVKDFSIDPQSFKLPVSTLLLSKNIVAGGSSVMLKKSIIENIGSFREDIIIGEDWEFWTRIFWNGYKPHFINKRLFSIRKNERSVQHTTSNNRWKKSVETVLRSFFSLPNIKEKEKSIIYHKLFLNSYRFSGSIAEILGYRKQSIYYNPLLLFNFDSNLITAKAFVKKIIKKIN